MEESILDINKKNSILVSRNTPIAFIVGVGGFIGSKLAEKLLHNRVQVIGIDDFSSGNRKNLEGVTRDKNFHLIDLSISNSIKINLPRLDYAFFSVDNYSSKNIYSLGLHNFLKFVKETRDFMYNDRELPEGKGTKNETEKPKIVFLSSIALYDNDLSDDDKDLKEGEVKFAKFVKYYRLNGRIVRLAPVFGPRMHFRVDDPTTRLIQAALNSSLQKEFISLDFTTRAIYIDDAVSLLVKSILSGSTAHKIYDGARIQPLKVSDVKQILLDPVWHEVKGFSPTELPPWPTPNLERTIKELSWRPSEAIVNQLKRTISYFKDSDIKVPEISEAVPSDNAKKWTFYTNENVKQDHVVTPSETKEPPFFLRVTAICRRLIVPTTLLLVGFSIFFPVGKLLLDSFFIRAHVKNSAKFLSEGDFQKAEGEIILAKQTVKDQQEFLRPVYILKELGLFSENISELQELVLLTAEGVDGIDRAIVGMKTLFKSAKILSGEINEDPRSIYEVAQTELTASSQKISKVQAKMVDKNFRQRFPDQISSRIEDLSFKLSYYLDLVEKVRAASFLLPKITAIEGKKTYLLLIQNNLELRPSGGFIGSYGKLTFENGRLKDVFVDDIYNLDGGLKDVIPAPAELTHDLGQDRLYLRDSNYEPDFPTSARRAEFLFRKESGEIVNGVIALDLTASSKLLSAVGGVDLNEYSEHIDGNNLFEKAVTHAEVKFFPGSQAKKNYLTALQSQLLNKVFYLSKQDWPSIIAAIGESLEEKHMMVYLDDPEVFTYLVSENWAGVMPRGIDSTEGEVRDFLAVVESNMGANKSNYYLERGSKLETSISKEDVVSHKLIINYRNNSPGEVFPAGKYKNRFKIYLPIGTKLVKATWGEIDITGNFTAFSDYGRSGYSVLIELLPREQKNLNLEYILSTPLEFKENTIDYRMDIIKQPGLDADPFEWGIIYPINYKLENREPGENQHIDIKTDLSRDRSFGLKFKKG